MKVTIFTVSYDDDLEFLKYNLKSIKKFCMGYHKNIVLIDDMNNSCKKTKEYLIEIGQPFFVDKEARKVKRGYVRQQYIKFMSDKYMPEGCEYICWVDSDNIFAKKHCPDVYFKKNKPIILKQKYKDIYRKIKNRRGEESERDINAFRVWQETTSKLIGFEVEYEYMQSMPFVYPLETLKRFREYLERLHGKNLLEIMKNIDIMADANLIGAYCEKFEKDLFYWIDGHHDPAFKKFIVERRDFYQHYSSRKKEQPHRYVDLNEENNIIHQTLNK